ncbi:hypothetical protein EC991_011391 [Linnemannia zychae]|nr:hypothetical protein EC991_011391 [Linnemannia zychae]
MSNYTSSSMSSLSTISTTSNMSGPSPSNVSLHSTLPRSPLRKTTAGGQHPLATVSIFETDSMIITETAEGRETDTPEADIQPSREEQATDASSTLGDRNQVALEDYVSTLDDTRSDHPKAILLSARSQTGSSSQDKKQEDLRLLKSAVLSGSHNILMLQIKPGTQAMDPDLAAAAAGMNTNNQDANESDWASVSVASGDGQPLSPLTASYPASVHQTTTLSSTDSIDTPASMESEDTSRTVESPAPTPTTPTTTTPQTSGTATANTDPSPLPRHEFEKWTPPPPKPRPTQDVHRVQPQAHSRLHFPRLLKQRSFNFPFTTSSSSLSSSTSTSSSSLQQNGSATTPVTRASVDGSSQGAGLRADDQDAATRTASCDIPRSVGPPDPIPLHYQHLQNRQNRRSSSFRRRSHGGELERFSPGWAVVKNNSNQGSQTGGATTPTRISMSDDQVTTSPSSETHQRRSSATTSRRHASLGVQPNLTSMWGRLLTSILPSGNEQHHSQDSDTTPTRDREFSGAAFAMDGDVDPYLQQQRLLLTPLSQQQQIHPLYQQQLFFYADEVVSQPRRSELDPPSFQMVAGDTSESQPRRSMASDAPSHFPALAHNAHLQGELAQEDGRESLEMSSAEAAAFMRPSSEFSGPGPALVIGEGGETILAPRSLSADGKIPVSSLALSQPPSYWEAEIKYKGFPKIEPRPEQGNESLPRYTCSVFREGCVNRKTELVGNWRPYRRPWKRTFAHLRGTALRLYAVDIEDVPRLHVRNISLQLAKCEIATDYKQRPNVIRIRACDRTVLIECKDRIDALTWLEHLQAAANIATSLEDRSMPKFYTLPRAPPHSQYGQGQGQGGSRSAASSTARSSVVSNVSNRHHQQTPQPIPQPVPSSSSTYPQRRASMMPTVVSPRSSTEVDATGGEGAGADTERRVRRSRSGGLLTRSLRTTMTEQDRRNEAAAAVLGDEAMLRNVLRALGHTPDSGSPSTEDEEEIDSDNDEDDGQGTDAEASPAAAIVANQGVAAAARRRSGAGSRRCGGSCHHHHHRGHHYHDHNTTITVAAAPTTTAGDATMDGEVAGAWSTRDCSSCIERADDFTATAEGKLE